ncbi:alpha/beta hydrolase [Compostimonas suwonensis]|uniref:Acetyl esterase/lipase n=1 Tax=Compostimonas suwonensis TaxID=1048394 RepID=A0A2M9BB31_9MICO|nr:alpha/beta hydrolase [Compostimonas suwonensis]PJJ55144.1 acetyl esterase/lipase [Compostimonas suwonensis]
MPQPARTSALRRVAPWAGLLALAGVVVGGVLAVVATPWPGALLIRAVFQRNNAKLKLVMEKHAPAGIERVAELQYREGDDDAHLDVYFPQGTSGPLPTIVWTHGGAWISGGKDDDTPYFQLLAKEGFTVVGLDYSLGPERRYPTAVEQLNDAHAYLLANAERLHVDTDRIFLAGDSAGAQLSSQLATLVTNPAYALDVGVTPALRRDQLRGVVLNCGIYQVMPLVGATGLFGWGDIQSIWAYTGHRDFASSRAVDQMSTHFHVTAEFPPTYLSGGNGDPLTDSQAKPFAERLGALGVDVTTLFWPDDREPALPHEYQFDLDTEAGQTALRATIDFLRAHSA